MPKFEPGRSGNSGGRPRVPNEFREACRAASPKALEVVIAALDDKSASLRLKAAEIILDRSWGKPAQSIDIAMQDAQEATLEAQRPLTRPEVNKALAELVTGAERELGLTAIKGATTMQRVQRLLEAPQGLPPQLYAALKSSGTIQ